MGHPRSHRSTHCGRGLRERPTRRSEERAGIRISRGRCGADRLKGFIKEAQEDHLRVRHRLRPAMPLRPLNRQL